MKDITKTYSNGEITIVWKPAVCIHSTKCWKGAAGLPEVFNPAVKPWINPKGAGTERIVEQVNNCPSGALGYYYNDQVNNTVPETTGTNVEVTPNGPLLVQGNINIKDRDGNTLTRQHVTAFCRCGHSANKPFCDGSHFKAGFIG